MHPSDSLENRDTPESKPAESTVTDASSAPAEALDPQTGETAVDVEDRRASPRRKKLLRVLVRNDSATLAPCTGWILDRSLGGMCVALDHEVEVGTILAVCRQPESVASRWVELRVLNVREQESTWELGCEFVRVPSWEVLLQFE
jgi:hypothetical protein